MQESLLKYHGYKLGLVVIAINGGSYESPYYEVKLGDLLLYRGSLSSVKSYLVGFEHALRYKPIDPRGNLSLPIKLEPRNIN